MTGKAFLARPDLLGYAALIAEEAAFGADLSDITGAGWTWTDLSADVRNEEGTSTTIARQDNVSQAPTARHSCSLNNNSGDYTPGNPTGSHYPNVKQNTPWRQRISRDGGATWKIRFQGYADGINPRALDASLRTKKVDVTAFGMLGRLDGRKRPLKAPLLRAISATAPAAFWPMDDGSSATAFASAVAGNTPMKIGAATVTPAGAADFPAGTTAAPELGATGMISAGLAIGATTAWSVGFAYRASATAVGAQRTIGEIFTTSGWRFVLTIADGSPGVGNVNVTLWARSADDATVVAIVNTAFVNTMDGKWHWCQAVVETAGTSAKGTLYVDGLTVTNTDFLHGIVIGTPTGADLGWLQDKYAPSTNAGSFALGPIAFWPSNVQQPIAGALDGWAGETVSDRLIRFCGEEGIALDLTGTSTVTMGPQRIATTVAILRDCEATDHGLMYDGLGPGIGYVCRSAMHNAAVALQIDAATNNQLTPPFEPYFDKQAIKNLWQVNRDGGQSVEAEKKIGPVSTDPIAGIGIEDAQATVNIDTDDALDAHAGWLLGLTTIEGMRYPALPINMRQVPQFAASVLALKPGSRVQVSGVRSESTDLPPETLDELLQGWTETTKADAWSIVGNHSPFEPFRIGKVGTMRVQAAASAIDAAFNSSASTFVVRGAAPWTTDASMFPVSIMFGGEMATLSGVASIGKDAFGRTVANGWGTADIGGAWTTTGGSASDYAVGSGVGTMTQTTAAVSRIAYLAGISVADFDVTCQVQVSATATGAGLRGYLLGRYSNAANSFYRAVLHFETTGVATLQLWKRVTGTDTQLTAVNLFSAYSPATFYTLRFAVRGSTLTAWAWPTAAPGEVVSTTITDTALTAAGSIGFSGVTVSGNTNVNPVITCDNFEITSPQTFTVSARSANGIVKAHVAGEPVTVFKPGRVGI